MEIFGFLCFLVFGCLFVCGFGGLVVSFLVFWCILVFSLYFGFSGLGLTWFVVLVVWRLLLWFDLVCLQCVGFVWGWYNTENVVCGVGGFFGF